MLWAIQCKIKQKYGVILKQFLKGGMKNFAFQNRVLQRDRVLIVLVLLERRGLEREYFDGRCNAHPSELAGAASSSMRDGGNPIINFCVKK